MSVEQEAWAKLKQLLLGNEAIALGALQAGVDLVTGYPGTPSTEVLETIKIHKSEDVYVEWSVNEKVALEVAAGASYTGARSLVTMKQVGLNVASDPLLSLSYIGVKGGMVILVGDDPGPFSSQTEQDTRHFARFANLPVLDPSSPEEAYEMVQYAFELSEHVKLPVLLRPTTRICHASSTVDVAEEQRSVHDIEGFIKSPEWVIFPSLSYRKHIQLEQLQRELSRLFSESGLNRITGSGTYGIVASGIAYAYVQEIVSSEHWDVKILKVGTPYPFPAELALSFLTEVDQVLVVEELDPVIEESLIEVCYYHGLDVRIMGKKTEHFPYAGEYTYEMVRKQLLSFLDVQEISEQSKLGQAVSLPLPIRTPALCSGCSHRASFYAVKKALRKQKAIFTGDIGCYTLGNAKPLEMVDTCLCMGAGLTMAQGLKRVQPDTKLIAFIGDSTFFHSGITGMINAVYNQSDITMVILDNRTTAMTGKQPHPGNGRNLMESETRPVDIYGLVQACGVRNVHKADPFDLEKSVHIVHEAVEYLGPSVVIFESPCVSRDTYGVPQTVTEDCISCTKCVKDLGCPAITLSEMKVEIDPVQCTGCMLCTQICPVEAIGSVTS